jgi:CHAT domain-containing protein
MKSHSVIAALLACVLTAAFGARPAASAEGQRDFWQQQMELLRLHEAGSDAQALQLAKQGLAQAIAEHGPDSRQAGHLHFGVGMASEWLGDFAAASREFAEAVRIREIEYGGDNPIAAQARERLGHALLKQNRLGEAEASYLRAAQIYREYYGESYVTAGAYAGLGGVKLAAGDPAAALSNYRKAVGQLTGKPTARAADRSQRESQIRENRDIFIGLGRAASALRGKAGADEQVLMDESFAAGQRAWATSAASALSKMTARLKAGDTGLGRAVQHLDELNDRIVELQQQGMDGAKALIKDNPAFSKIMDSVSSASGPIMKEMAPLMKRQAELAPLTERMQENSQRLQDLMKRCPRPSLPGCEGSGKERAALTKEASEVSAKFAQESKGLAAPSGEGMARMMRQLVGASQTVPGFAELADAQKDRSVQSRQLEEEYRTARADVARRFPEYMSIAEPDPLSVAETQGLLKNDEALVAILTAPESSMVWVVTPEGAEWAEIRASEAVLAQEVSALREGLDPAGGDPASFDTGRSYRLYELLLGRFSAMLAGKQHLMFVATGPLSSLPFQVLVTEPPKPNLIEVEALRRARWLIRDHALSVLPSVQSLSSLRKLAAAGIAPKPYFGMGDPELEGRASQAGGARGGGKRPPALAALYRNGGAASLPILQTLPPLPETSEELKTVASSLGAAEDSVALGPAATKDRLNAMRLQDYRILHFATHALVAGELSGLQEPALVLSLPPQSSKAEDALLTASEVASLRLNADWAVLSACNTAAGDKAGADALSGLARAFIFAGARALLVSHWPVNSEATVNLTTRTFAYLAKTPQASRAEAFRQAMVSLIKEGNPPALWAPFVIVGEGGPVRQGNG